MSAHHEEIGAKDDARPSRQFAVQPAAGKSHSAKQQPYVQQAARDVRISIGVSLLPDRERMRDNEYQPTDDCGRQRDVKGPN
jgi:hypothetical protein